MNNLKKQFDHGLPLVVLIGRANTGKSSLFNKIIGQRKAITSDIAGTTRDIISGHAYWNGINFVLMDTGGIDKIASGKKLKDIAPKENKDYGVEIMKRSQDALKRADIILFVVDNQAGIQSQDRELAKALRKYKKPIYLLANKSDKMKDVQDSARFHSLGFEKIIPVSAYTSIGLGDLLDEITKTLIQEFDSKKQEKVNTDPGISVSLVGRPNVGKSSLFNKLLGEEKAIVSDVAHTTREPNDITLVYGDNLITFVDTAGMRKKGKVERGLESASVSKTREVSHRAECALFVLDVSEPFTQQDKHLAEMLIGTNSGVIIVANKYDLLGGKETGTQNELSQKIYRAFPFLTWAPIAFVSAKTGQHVDKLFGKILDLHQRRNMIIPQNELDIFMEKVKAHHRPTAGKGIKAPVIRDFEQVGTNPPKFMIRIRPQDHLAVHYLRYLENQLREHFGFIGVRLWITVKK